MKAGKLDCTITLLQPGAVTDDGYTEKAGAHSSAGTRRAQLMPASPQEGFELQGRVGKSYASFLVRFDSLTRTVDATWKLEYNNARYDVVGVTERGRMDGLVIEAVADDRDL